MLEIDTHYRVKINGIFVGIIEKHEFYPDQETVFSSEELRQIADKLDELNEVIK